MKTLLAAVLVFLAAQPGLAQTASVPFGVVNHDAAAPVEITADSFTVSQADGRAEFSGNVVVGQGEMRLSAGKISVEYSAGDGEETGRIDRMIASGGVTLVSGSEAAEAERAIYSITDGTIRMEGNVLLTQGQNALSGQVIVIDLADGSARIEGRVKTIFKTGGTE